jgi:hypothetical protein
MTQSDFDSWLEAELHRHFASSRDRSQLGMSRRASGLSGARKVRVRSRVSTLPLAGRVALALAAATVGLGAVSAAAATAVTHSANPAAWGQQVREAVQDCKQNLGVAHHGIGDCVSAFARQHGGVDKPKHAPPSAENSPAAANPPSAPVAQTTLPDAKTNGKSDQAPGHLASPGHGNPGGPGTKGKSGQPHPGASPKPHP